MDKQKKKKKKKKKKALSLLSHRHVIFILKDQFIDLYNGTWVCPILSYSYFLHFPTSSSSTIVFPIWLNLFLFHDVPVAAVVLFNPPLNLNLNLNLTRSVILKKEILKRKCLYLSSPAINGIVIHITNVIVQSPRTTKYVPSVL